MNRREILREFIATKLLDGSHPALGYDDDLLMSGLLDSLKVIRLATFAQEQFGVEIPPQDVVIDHFISIEALNGYLESRGV